MFFDLVVVIFYGDKLGYFCLFGLLILFINFVFKFKIIKVVGYEIYLVVFIVFMFVVLEEFS